MGRAPNTVRPAIIAVTPAAALPPASPASPAGIGQIPPLTAPALVLSMTMVSPYACGATTHVQLAPTGRSVSLAPTPLTGPSTIPLNYVPASLGTMILVMTPTLRLLSPVCPVGLDARVARLLLTVCNAPTLPIL